MTYPTLKKLYYQNENTWKKEYQNRYSASFTERFEFTIKEYNHKNLMPFCVIHQKLSN